MYQPALLFLRLAPQYIRKNLPNQSLLHLSLLSFSTTIRGLELGAALSLSVSPACRTGARFFGSLHYSQSILNSSTSTITTGLPDSRAVNMANMVKLEGYACTSSASSHLGKSEDLDACMAAGDCRACDHVKVAVARLEVGGVVAVPTDTVYGICCLAQSDVAVERIYAIKGRDADKPLAICVSDVSDVFRWGMQTIPDALLHALLPGPVTVVLARTPALNPRLNPDTPLVGVRVPDSGFVRDVCRACAAPLALTSANVSGASSSICVMDFESLWSRLDVVFDAGHLGTSNAGSTVVDLSKPGLYSVIRPGSALDQTVTTLRSHGLRERVREHADH